jgi:hypothetical protein
MLRLPVTVFLATIVAVHSAVIASAAAPAQAGTAAIQGTVQSATGQALPNYIVRLRNLQNGQLVAATTSDPAGGFSFTGLNPLNCVIEVVNPAGTIVATSSALTVTAGATVTVTVTASAVAAVAGITTAAAAAAAGGGTAAAGITTAVIITTIAAGAGIAGVVVAATQPEASGSR